MAKTLVVPKSDNEKTGACVATYRPESSCPLYCPLYGQGCYAENHINGSASLKERADKYGHDGQDNVRAIAEFAPKGATLRLNVSGDFLDADGNLDVEYVNACNYVHAARPDITIIAYSHAWRAIPRDAFTFTVVASCDNDRDVSDATAAGWPVAIVEPSRPTEAPVYIGRVIAGKRVVTCPNVTKGVKCVDCRLCARPERAHVAFPVHGASRRRAAAAVLATR